MKITLYGAAGTVTGSAYWVQSGAHNLLIDFGVFQGDHTLQQLNHDLPPIDPHLVNAIVITHAHLDHIGRLPILKKAGFNNPIYATAATIEMAALILHDSLKVQTFDLEKTNRNRLRQGLSVLTLPFSKEDVEGVLRLMTPLPYEEPVEILPGIKVRMVEAGHILGSASVELIASEQEKTVHVVFSGDLGPQGMAILKDPEPFKKADLVFMESTYGDRDHRSLKDTLLEGEEIIREAIGNRGKILIPSFAVGRTQQLLYYLAAARHRGENFNFPVYLDSPMAIEATQIYMKHQELYDEEAMELFRSGDLMNNLNHVQLCITPEQSKALNDVEGPCMILAGAGMCNAGRILHHLRHNLWKPETSVIIVGYQANGTLGRQLIDGVKNVTIFGEKIAVKAKIHSLGGLSAHAGQSDLIRWFNSVSPSRPKLVLSHGEDKAREPLAKIIKNNYGIQAFLPNYGNSVEI
ncbi:MAG: MBL fold metallo-hydrolase [Bacteroidota bacterium]|nr:MBL fold metallo-hydrolase [Bacteroidota bacterium]